MDEKSEKRQKLSSLITEHLENNPYTNQRLYFEGLKPFEERDVQDLFHCPPGYCYQQNETFVKTLLANGWNESTIRRKGTIVIKRFSDEIDDSLYSESPMTHSILFVDNLLVDVGFSDNSLRDALHFREIEEEIHFHGDIYKFQSHPEFHNVFLAQAEWWSISVKVDERWLQLWRFPRNIDISFEGIVDLNNLLFRFPRTINIRDNFFVTARVTPEERMLLSSPKATPEVTLKIVHSRNNTKNLVVIPTWESFEQVMRESFGLTPLLSLRSQLFPSTK